MSLAKLGGPDRPWLAGGGSRPNAARGDDRHASSRPPAIRAARGCWSRVRCSAEHPCSSPAAELARRGVDWVYADRRRSPVSPDLAGVAELVHRTADVDVYRLRQPVPGG